MGDRDQCRVRDEHKKNGRKVKESEEEREGERENKATR